MEKEPKTLRKIQPPTLTIELEHPIVMKGTEETIYTEIELREPNLDQITSFVKKVGKENPLDCMRWLISELSGIPRLALGQLKAREYYKAQTYLTFFLEPPDEDDPEGNVAGSR
ncbi:phage tail assembly protein [Robbsia andropogonis]|uniref:phage tail assembly protein n=1 Tax=Robbsia andropogonis TaxID=28092 RepID=UPI003D1D360C